jgi:hypothetical protein
LPAAVERVGGDVGFKSDPHSVSESRPIMELEITGTRVVRIWWAYLWRSLIAIVASMLIGGVVGFVVGAILGAMGVSARTIQIVCAPIGFIIGMAISIVPLRMILGKDFGEFRVVLLANYPQDESPSESPTQSLGRYPR